MSTVSLAGRISQSLTGYVQNSSSSSSQVLGQVQGPEDSVERFVQGLKCGPAGRVDKVETKAIEEVEGEKRFVQR